MKEKRRIQDIVIKKKEDKPKKVQNELVAPVIVPKKVSIPKNELKNDKSGIKISKDNEPQKNKYYSSADLPTKKRLFSSSPDLTRLNKEPSSSFSLWGIAILSFIILIFVILGRDAKTLITVSPRTILLPTNIELKAVIEPVGDQLGYDKVELDIIINPEKDSTPLVMVENFAQGNVVLYNEYSKNSQKLLPETRLMSSDGKIYKTPKEKEIIIPGYTTSADGQIIAGSVEVLVTAEKVGPDYNKSYTDFKIAGFQGGPKFDKFYGRTKGPITGGEKVYQPSNSSSTDSATEEDFYKEQIVSNAKDQLKARLPEGFFIPSNFLFTDQNIKYDINDTGKIQISSKVTGIILSKDDLAKTMSSALLDISATNAKPYIINVEDLDYVIKDFDQVSNELTFSVEKDANFSFTFNEQDLKLLLLSKTKEEAKSILEANPAIIDFKLKIRPFWLKKIPDNQDRVKFNFE